MKKKNTMKKDFQEVAIEEAREAKEEAREVKEEVIAEAEVAKEVAMAKTEIKV
jgi:hypothetical protein